MIYNESFPKKILYTLFFNVYLHKKNHGTTTATYYYKTIKNKKKSKRGSFRLSSIMVPHFLCCALRVYLYILVYIIYVYIRGSLITTGFFVVL